MRVTRFQTHSSHTLNPHNGIGPPTKSATHGFSATSALRLLTYLLTTTTTTTTTINNNNNTRPTLIVLSSTTKPYASVHSGNLSERMSAPAVRQLICQTET